MNNTKIYTYNNITITLYHGDYLTAPIPSGYLLCITDPPYGITDNEWDKHALDLPAFWNKLLPLSQDKTIFILTGTAPFIYEVYNSNAKMFKQELIWKKSFVTNFFDANVKAMRIHENIILFCKKSRYASYNPQKVKGKKYKNHAKQGTCSTNYNIMRKQNNRIVEDRYPTTVIDIHPSRTNHFHPTQKPVALFEYLIRTYSNETELVIDPFFGSATAAIACINSNRNFFGCEQNDEYFAKACNRVEKHIKQLEENFSLLLPKKEDKPLPTEQELL